ncbi:MAG: hypothetical protein Q9227_007349 [Pyrenula ochraceoflavens]
MTSSAPRGRIRSVLPSLYLGRWTPGQHNAITDVPGILVHTQSIHEPKTDTHDRINTGVTTILPRKNWFDSACYAGIFRFNGSGEMTGTHWLEETGLLNSPILITNSFAVGACYNGTYEWAIREHRDEHGLAPWFIFPVVAETFDGYCNDIAAMPVQSRHAVEGIDGAKEGPVEEGCTGGGTGMICQGFKGGTGTASRLLDGLIKKGESEQEVKYTIAALCQTNFGQMVDLKIGGAPVGRLYMKELERRQRKQPAWETPVRTANAADDSKAQKEGSIIVIIATDAPLNPIQCQRLARRAPVGIARVGGWGSNSSGDLALAFSTANEIPRDPPRGWKPTVSQSVDVVQDVTMNALLDGAADCVEEAIYNSITMAEDSIGPLGREVKAIDLDLLKEIMQKYE